MSTRTRPGFLIPLPRSPLLRLLPALLAVLCCTGGPASRARAADPPPHRPNFVFILADDLGWRDLGCYGSTFYETPHLDALAAQGCRFTDGYAACNVCSPTRASIMTGKYPARLHLTDWLPGRPDMPSQKLRRPKIINHLPDGEVTLAAALKEAGYTTAFIGKWHLGGPEFYPEHFGFDSNVAGCELGHPPTYFSPYRIPTLPDGPKGEYLTDRLTDEAVKFIDKAAGEGVGGKADKTDKGDAGAPHQPFFLYLCHYAVHNPQQAKAEMVAKYKAKAAALRPAGGPEFLPEGANRCRQVQDQPVYAAMVQSLDESVGRILKELADRGLEKDTVVIFMSDNGGLSTAEGAPTSNVPLRAGKGWPYEGGVREPLIVKWPGVARAGSVCRQPVISTDFYPTILEMAGLPLRPAQHVDGASFAAAVKSAGPPSAGPDAGGAATPRPLFWHYPHYSNQGGGPEGAVRVGDFKLVEWYEDGRTELFNLRDDLGEKHDLAGQMPEKMAELKNQLHAWRDAVKADMPTPNPDYDPAKAKAKKGQAGAGRGGEGGGARLVEVGLGPDDDD